ncbi:MAG: Beta-glucosidase A [Verrucomicrobiae bacterium]|nr:Beta-glucosidase A [Verrucomicrobiae bacterium]
MNYRMPKSFQWGVASAAYQVEGGWNAGGRGPSIWDTWCHKNNRVSGDNACFSYQRWREDVQLLKNLGVQAYRFSISWPRVLPTGRAPINQRGLDYYDRLVDALLQNKIKPFVTLYHWDLPQALEDTGGWQSRETAYAYADYARLMVERLGDRVTNWMTFNEIPTGIGKGYELGIYAPALKVKPKALALIYHHVLVAQGLGIRAMRAARPGQIIGIAHDPFTPVPVIEDAAHIKACAVAYERLNAYLMDPMFRGTYPKFLPVFPEVKTGDMKLVSEPLDFVGLNIYSGLYTEPGKDGYQLVKFPTHYPTSEGLDWLRFIPQALYWATRHVDERYGVKAIYITENGWSSDRQRDVADWCNDVDRILYLRCYLRELHHAISEGIPVRGYFLWSLLDNFEWASGYSKGLGLYYVNHKTGERRPKRSAGWYKTVVHANTVV